MEGVIRFMLSQKINGGRSTACAAGKGIASIIRRNMVAWLILLPSVILFYYIVWRPIFVGMYYSMFYMKGYEITSFAGLKNYKDVLTDTLFIKTFLNTLQYVGWSVLIGIPLPIIIGILLNEVVHIKGFCKLAVYFPMIIPGIAASMIWYYMYFPDQSGLLNMFRMYFGLEPLEWLQNKNMTIFLIIISMTWKGMGGTVIMYLAALTGVDQNLYEAAKLDGAGFLGRIRHITLPRLAGMILLMGARQIISVFQVMEQPLAMTGGGPNNASVTLALQTYRYAFEYFRMDKALALGTVTFLMLLVFTVIYFFLEKKIDE